MPSKLPHHLQKGRVKYKESNHLLLTLQKITQKNPFKMKVLKGFFAYSYSKESMRFFPTLFPDILITLPDIHLETITSQDLILVLSLNRDPMTSTST